MVRFLIDANYFDTQSRAIKAAHGAGTSVSVLAREYTISRASILNIAA